MSSIVREPAVGGRFYPADPNKLRVDVESYLSPVQSKPDVIRAIGCMVPHAGYVYSGQVAGAVFASVDIPESCIVIGPNHTGRGHPLAVMKEGQWQTPLGTVQIDSELAEELMKSFAALTEDFAAHRYEHAIEVEIPFLQVRRPDVKFAPIAIGTGQFLILQQLGSAIAEVVRRTRAGVLIVASSDMNHYENDATTRVKDRKAIDKILNIDAAALYQTVINESISMCGFGPAVVMLTAARQLGAQKAKLVQYATSGDVSGDRDIVVGYAGVVIY